MKTILHYFVSLLLVSSFYLTSKAQTTVILKAEQDARISIKPADPSVANTNYGSWPSLVAMAWTNASNPVQYRALIKFDLSSIPLWASIDSATLSLYYNPTSLLAPHDWSSGSNSCSLNRITASWNEVLVTWNTQPSITTVNLVTIPQSATPTQDYPNIDVTQLVQDMVNDPANSHGFLYKLNTEVEYRKMIFASSDNADTTIHPTLKVTYTLLPGFPESEFLNNSVVISPNPFTDFTYLELERLKNSDYSVAIYNVLGQEVKRIENVKTKKVKITRDHLPPGMYLLQLESANSIISSKKLIIGY